LRIHESAENYLEAILILKDSKPAVRSIDVANYLGFSKPSISLAMKQFRENGYITVDKSGAIELTQKGMEIAKNMYERHILIADMLTKLGVSKEVALSDSCKIEHAISEETFLKIKDYYETMK